MKNVLFLFVLCGLISVSPVFFQAQESIEVPKEQERDASELARKIKAQLPIGWIVEYPVVYPRTNFFDPKPAIPEPEVLISDFSYILIRRIGKIKMLGRNLINISGREDIYQDEEFILVLRIAPFLSKGEYEKLFANNQNIEKRLKESRDNLEGIKRRHKNSGYLPETPEEKALLKAHSDLKRELTPQIVALPHFYFSKISLKYGGASSADDVEYYRVKDKVLRRECAIVAQRIDGLLTRYSGDKFKIDEKALNDY